jgi:hypothetical protein
MKIGFTGTQIGMSDFQLETLERYLMKCQMAALMPGLNHEFHHGDCIGADEEAHEIALIHNYNIVIHPPLNSSKRAFCDAWTLTHDRKPYLERNHNIVDACDVLVVAPKSDEEELRSGTWATYRYAIKKGKPVMMLPREAIKR